MELPAAETFPPPDEHLVEPETEREMLDGRVIRVPPAAPPHADRQVAIGYVLNATVEPSYIASSELLTRVSDDSDFATDVCIRKAGKDAQGHRYLEELSFEIKHTQSQSDLDKRARYLARRGVRRVFAVYVRVEKQNGEKHVIAGPIKEWSAENNDWRTLPNDAAIEDRCLRRPVKVRALLDAFAADNAVAHALIDKKTPCSSNERPPSSRESGRACASYSWSENGRPCASSCSSNWPSVSARFLEPYDNASSRPSSLSSSAGPSGSSRQLRWPMLSMTLDPRAEIQLVLASSALRAPARQTQVISRL